MAKQKGILRIDGTLGGVTFYNKDGENIAKLKSDISKERIMTDVAFKLTRQNMAEFGGAAKAGKSLRMAFVQLIKFMGGSRIAGRVVAVTREVISRGAGIRGRRSFLVVANAPLLEGFEFAPGKHLASVFNAPFTSAVNAGRNEVTVTIPDFATGSFIAPPQGATHFRIVNAIGVLSDFNYDVSMQEYQPASPALNEDYAVTYSGYIPLDDMVGADTTLVATLPGAPAMTANVGLLSSIGIEFYQLVNSLQNQMSAGNAMRIQTVY